MLEDTTVQTDSEIAAAVRAKTDEEVAALVRAAQPPKVKRARKPKVEKAPKPAKEPKEPKVKAEGTRSRSTKDEVASNVAALVAAVVATPGQGIGDYAKLTGIDVKKLGGSCARKTAIEAGLIYQDGERSKAVYFPGAKPTESAE